MELEGVCPIHNSLFRVPILSQINAVNERGLFHFHGMEHIVSELCW